MSPNNLLDASKRRRSLREKEALLDGDAKQLAEITEEKQAEEALRESEEKYRELLTLSPVGITTLDMKGVITSCNPTVYDVGGYSEGELIGKHFTKIAPLRLRDIPKFLRVFSSIIRGKVPQPFVVTYTRKDGTTGWTEIHASLLKEGGKKLGVQVIQKDITERKRTEEDFENIFNLSPDMMGVFTAEGRLIKANRSWETILGYKTEELLEMGWVKLIHPDDIEQTNNEVEKQLKGSPVVNFVNRYKCKDGSYRTLEWQATFAQEGIVHAIARDITEQKCVGEAAWQSDEKYRKLFGNMLDGFAYYRILLDEDNQPIDYVYLEVNNAWERLTRLKKEDVIGKRITEVIPGIKKSKTDLISIYGKVALTGEKTEFELYFKPFKKWFTVSVYSPQKE